jgi:uncharacterized membrane protein
MDARLAMIFTIMVVGALLAVITIYNEKREKRKSEANYENFIILGIVFIMFGLISRFYAKGTGFMPLGVIFFGIGIAGVFGLKGEKPSERQKLAIYSIVAMSILLTLVLFMLGR